MAPFYGWGSTVSKATESLRGNSLLFKQFTIQFPSFGYSIDLPRKDEGLN